MENEKLHNGNAANSDSEEKLQRREVARRGRFLAYTAPALVALATSKNACANRSVQYC